MSAPDSERKADVKGDLARARLRMLRPGRLFKRAPKSDDGEGIDLLEVGSWLVVLLYLVGAGTACVLPFVFYAQYSGSFRWVLTLVLVTVLGILTLYLLHYWAKVRTMPAPEPDIVVKDRLPFADLNGMMERSSNGMRYSQVMLSERVSDLFLEKVRIAKGRSVSESQSAVRSLDRMMGFCGDGRLSKFAVDSRESVGKPTERLSAGEKRADGLRFEKEINEVLDRIERWR